ncbi:MAG: PucR family transcriptional regulator, partial [Pseudonocardia sp.]
IVRWMRGGELLLTTAYPVREDVSALTRLVPQFAERELAALGIKIGPYLGELPPELLAIADRLDFPIVQIPSDVIFNDILSEVLGTILNRQAVELERSHTIHERLTAVGLAGGSHQDLLGALAELICLPVAILDERRDAVVVAGDPPLGSEEPDLSRPIRSGRSVHGEVVAWTGGKVVLPHQSMAMEQAATIAAIAIAQERAVVSREQRHRTLLLMELVSGRPLDRAEMARRADAMGWNLDGPRAAVLVELANASGPLRVVDQPIEDQLVRVAQEVTHPQPIVWSLRSGLAMLVAPDRAVSAVCQKLHDRLSKVRPGLRVMVASGRAYSDFSEFQRSYQEAVEVLTLGREICGQDFVLGHDDLGVYRLLYQLPHRDLERHVSEELGPLLEYDERRGGALVETLECYFRHNRNKVPTAAELNVHYNTLRYRLERIERLTGGIDRNTTSRLQLELSVHAYRVLTAKSKS